MAAGFIPVRSSDEPITACGWRVHTFRRLELAGEQTSMDLERIRRAVREILLAVGEDPDREGLRETPDRVARMYAEVFDGLHQDPRGHLKKLFTQKYDEIVSGQGHSPCQFLRAPPAAGRREGPCRLHSQRQGHRPLEDSARGRRACKRPQMQERLTEELADLLMKELDARGRRRRDRGQPQLHDDPRGQEARQHVCDECHERGFQEKPATRSELMSLIFGSRA